SCLLSCDASGAATTWDETRYIGHVAAVVLAEPGQAVAFFRDRETRVHPYQHRVHGQREQGRPMQQETGHDQEEACILRMTDSRIGTCACHDICRDFQLTGSCNSMFCIGFWHDGLNVDLCATHRSRGC